MNMLESISSYNFVEVDGYAYFSNLFYNALFKVEIETGRATFLGNFENEKISENNIHLEAVLEKDKIYFFPRRGNSMYIYHLTDRTLQAVEIRKKSEGFFVIEEVILEEDYIFFLPQKENNPIIKLDRNTCKVTKVSDKLRVQGKCLSEYRNRIPVTIVEKYNIKHGLPISCRQMSNGKWYCFMPIGRQILCFRDGDYNLETIPLTVVNEPELQRYLYKVKQELFKARIFFPEFTDFKIQEFLEAVILFDKSIGTCCKGEDGYSIGEIVWKTVRK